MTTITLNNNEIINEIALRCGDSDFKDFPISIYNQAYYRANRAVAKTYQLLQKVLVFTTKDMVTNTADDIILDIPDFNSEILVRVNDIPLKKKGQHLEYHDRYSYYMELRDGQWIFNYVLGDYTSVLGNPRNIDITELMNVGVTERTDEQIAEAQSLKGMEDEVVIVYNIIPDRYTEKEGEFIIPSRYEEEIIKEGINYIAKLGIAKFTDGGEKQKKYEKIMVMYTPRSDKDKELLTSGEFIKIRPYTFPDRI